MDQPIREKELMVKITMGDQLAFEHLFKAYYSRLVVFARKFVVDNDMAQDIVQSVFVILWEKKNKLQISSPGAYLMVSVRNQCLNELKQQKNLISTEEKHVNIIDKPFDIVPSDDVIERVNNVISEMPPQRQKIFRMNRFEGLKYREIAVVLGLSVKTVEAQMGKALQYLREKIPLAINSE